MRLLRAGAIYAAANIASAAVPFLLLPMLTRVLGPSQFGSVVAFMLLVTLCQALAGLSMNAAVSVACFKRTGDDLRQFNGSALAVAAASTGATAALVAAVLVAWPALGGGITPGWGALAALTAGANIVLQCRLVAWQAQHRALASAALQFSTSGVNVALSLLAVVVLSWGGDGRNAAIAAAYVFAGLAGALLLWSGNELAWAPSKEHVRSLLAFGAPLVVHALAGAGLATADRWAVGLRLDTHALGIYGAAAQLGMVMAMLADAFVKAFTPWLYDLLQHGGAKGRSIAVGAVYVAVPGFMLLAMLVGALLHLVTPWLLGARYAGAGDVLPWFMLGGAFGGIYMCMSAVLFFEARTARLAGITLATAVIGAGSTWLLVGRFGLAGAAAGYALTQATLAVLSAIVVMRSVALPWANPGTALRTWLQSVLDSQRQHAAATAASHSSVENPR